MAFFCGNIAYVIRFRGVFACEIVYWRVGCLSKMDALMEGCCEFQRNTGYREIKREWYSRRWFTHPNWVICMDGLLVSTPRCVIFLENAKIEHALFFIILVSQNGIGEEVQLYSWYILVIIKIFDGGPAARALSMRCLRMRWGMEPTQDPNNTEIVEAEAQGLTRGSLLEGSKKIESI